MWMLLIRFPLLLAFQLQLFAASSNQQLRRKNFLSHLIFVDSHQHFCHGVLLRSA